MDRLKKFFADKKVNKSFKNAGAGHVLSSNSAGGPSTRPSATQAQQAGSSSRQQHQVDRAASADVAAQAAFKRMNVGAKQETTTQRNIRMRAQKELEEERQQRELESRRRSTGAVAATDRTVSDQEVSELEHSSAIEGVYFTCELLGDDIKLGKSEMKDTVEAFLLSQLAEDALVASSLMLFSLNPIEKRRLASETLKKYIRNLLENVDDRKFRRIRISNPAFQERVVAAKGGRDFLEACGFEMRMERLNESSEPEPFLVIPEKKARDLGSLVQAIDLLQGGHPVPLKLHRNPTIYHLTADQKIPMPVLSSDFFDLSASEVKKEQADLTADVEKMLSLRTREMREKDENIRSCVYRYTIIRIRFPNDFLIEGTFSTQEKFLSVREFVTEYLANVEPKLFVLTDPAEGVMDDEDNWKTLAELGFMPAVIIHFEWDADVLAHLKSQYAQVPYLHERYMAEAKNLQI